jgi:hypothetical protein
MPSSLSLTYPSMAALPKRFSIIGSPSTLPSFMPLRGMSDVQITPAEIESRVMDVMGSFEKVDKTKVI